MRAPQDIQVSKHRGHLKPRKPNGPVGAFILFLISCIYDKRLRRVCMKLRKITYDLAVIEGMVSD